MNIGYLYMVTIYGTSNGYYENTVMYYKTELICVPEIKKRGDKNA